MRLNAGTELLLLNPVRFFVLQLFALKLSANTKRSSHLDMLVTRSGNSQEISILSFSLVLSVIVLFPNFKFPLYD